MTEMVQVSVRLTLSCVGNMCAGGPEFWAILVAGVMGRCQVQESAPKSKNFQSYLSWKLTVLVDTWD